ncbi:MAG: ATP-binding protein [Propionibacteriaceae bacterium]
MRLLTRSLRGRLVLAAVAVGLTFGLLFGLVATWRIHRAEDQAISAALQNRLELARGQVAADGALRSDPVNPKSDLIQLIAADGAVLTSTAPLRGVGPLADPVTVASTSNDGVQGRVVLQVPDVDIATLAVPVVINRDGHSETGALVVGVDTEGFTTANTSLTGILVAGLSSVVVVLATLAWFVTGRALRSVSRLTESAEHVGSADLARGLPVPVDDAELSRLVQALNRMLGRIDHSHTTELAFAADAGHRLRTPVATLRAEAELALRDPDPENRTLALVQIITDADQLTLIVDRMLSRSRRRARGPGRAVTALLLEAADRWQRQAELATIRLTVVLAPGIPGWLRCDVAVDVIDPLVENAIRHTHTGEHIHVTATVVNDHDHPENRTQRLAVDVTNTGLPVPSELAPHIFDAWVSSREGSAAGGLGLWIARETARDVGGEITLDQDVPGQTTFHVTLPTGPIAGDQAATDTSTG